MRLILAPLFISSSIAVVSAAVKCKCMPGDSCFPSATDWAAFSKTLSQPLIVGQRPVAAVCYPAEASFNADACATLQANKTNDVYLSSLINGVHRLNFDSIVNSTTIQSCPYTPGPNTTCFQGRVPPYAINVTSVSDVQAGVKFAAKHNLRLVVKNSGHEGMGRPFGVGALELYMFSLKNISFSAKFVPERAPANTPPQAALTVGAGVNWATAYAVADANNQTVVGGLSPQGTVGAAAGWPMGGGHSIISPFYGLGVDNAIQFVVVRPDGSLVTVNKYTDPDHFWAIRGGGGPSFGVVIATTYKTHPSTAYTAQYFGATGTTPEAYRALLTVWMKYHNEIVDAGWGGVWPFVNTTLFVSFVTQNSPPSLKANQTMEKFLNETRSLPGVIVLASTNKGYRSFNDYFTHNLIDISILLGVDFSTVVPSGVQDGSSSWLMPRDTTAPKNAATFANLLANSTLLGLPFTVGGGAVNKADPDSAAACPAWRKTILDMTFVSAASETDDVRTHYDLVHQTIQPYRALAPPPYGGQYLNEPDILEPDWQQAYWGSHYPRLLAIKKKIDPKDLLIVRKGVNSEGWDDEIICKKT